MIQQGKIRSSERYRIREIIPSNVEADVSIQNNGESKEPTLPSFCLFVDIE